MTGEGILFMNTQDNQQFIRFEMMYGKSALCRLKNAKVALFGLGGVGGHVLEVLARSGIGTLYLYDNDTISVSNLNRQILSTYETLGSSKTKAARERVSSINKEAIVYTFDMFVLPENIKDIDFSRFDYVIDAIDTVSGKLAIIEASTAANVPVISCMGTGNKIHPEMLKIADIYDTSVCPLARVMRKELKMRGVAACNVLYSEEVPIKPLFNPDSISPKPIPASNAYVPAAAGILIGSKVVNDLIAGPAHKKTRFY